MEDKNRWRLTGSWAGAWKIFLGVGVLGLVGAVFGYMHDPRRFAFAWLFAFITVLTLALGALFFVLTQHLTSAGWSVTVRRTAEFFAVGILAMIPLFLPVVLAMHDLFPALSHGSHGNAEHGAVEEHHSAFEIIPPAYAQESSPATPPGAAGRVERGALPGTHGVPGMPGVPGAPGMAPGRGGPHGLPGAGTAQAPWARAGLPDPHEIEHHEVMEKKAGYFKLPFFFGRAVAYFIIWGFLAWRLFKNSTSQDITKDPKFTLKSQAFAPGATFLFALSLTFAGFDWIMALEPMWFSTIFGVYIFAGAVVSSYAMLILVTLALRSGGPLAGAVTVEHYHDLGKLLFGFLIFWAYIGFSQFMLIWYAALPEETTFFHNRWDHAPWPRLGMMLVLVGFVVPFLLTISRTFKRNLGRLEIGAIVILIMHAVDIYWLVMPNVHLGQAGFSTNLPDLLIDIACLLAVGGIYGAFVFGIMRKYSLVPVGDPRLQRSLHFQNA